MTEKPILFNAEMVRAILKGTKTQTRRVIKSTQQTSWLLDDNWSGDYIKNPDNYLVKECPHGNPGDLMWVRESIRKRDVYYEFTGAYGATYLADLTPVMGQGDRGSYLGRAVTDWKWKRDTLPSIFMPRWASRITLEITEVRVERIQQISYEDIKKEGFCLSPTDDFPRLQDLGIKLSEADLLYVQDEVKSDFIKLWDSINAKRGYSWQDNPWVWVISFKVKE